MPSFVIGTAGHVDHGKTTLVRALTGVDTDRLPEEKRRGISIELGFAPWRVAEAVQATIVDVPGHRRLIRTMIAGASGIELVLVIVAADEGVMPQTREHLRVCEVLGIRDAVFVLTKSDVVDAETLALAEAEVREEATGRFSLDVVACSAVRGDGLEELRETVAARLRMLSRAESKARARVWIDRVMTIAGAGTVVTGTLTGGSVEVGQELTLIRSGTGPPRTVLVRGLRIHADAVRRAEAKVRLGVQMPIAVGDVRRGDLLTDMTPLATTTLLDAMFVGKAPPRNASVSFHTGTTSVGARVTHSHSLPTGDALVRLKLATARPVTGGDRFLLTGQASKEGSLLGGGTVIDARPPRRSNRAARLALANAVAKQDAEALLHGLVDEVLPKPLDLALLHERLAFDPLHLRRTIDLHVAQGSLVPLGDLLLPRSQLRALADEARALVRDHARAHPLERGLPLATLQHKLAEKAGPAAAAGAILAARASRGPSDDGLISVESDVVTLGHRESLDPVLADALAAVERTVLAAGSRGATLAQVATATGGRPDVTRAILARLERSRSVVRANDLWFSRTVIVDLRARLVAHLASKRTVTVAEFKELGELPRNQAVCLLEYFDQIQTTLRQGDVRVLGSDG